MKLDLDIMIMLGSFEEVQSLCQFDELYGILIILKEKNLKDFYYSLLEEKKI
jgi:hypothetical protein